MDFQRVRIEAFGPLRGLDTGEEALPRLVVVQGPNEAGKSTFFHFLTSLLYGFYPASRERNPFAPWDGREVEGEGVIRLESGDVWEVHRRLLSAPTGTLVRGSSSEELRNRTLPCVDHVPLAVFRQVFALTLAELARLAGESWERIQDRLVAGMGASDLASVRETVEELEREAGRLWRPNRRGNQKVRDLREKLRDLRRRRGAAADNERRLREAVRERNRVERELREAREEREACRIYVERYRALLPIREQLERIEMLEEDAGDPDELKALPPEPRVRLEELGNRVEELEGRLAELEREAGEPRAVLEAFDEDRAALLEHADRIRGLLARAAGLDHVRVRIAQLEQELKDLERRAETLAGELFDQPGEDVPEAVLRIPVDLLRRDLGRLLELREARHVAERAAESETPELHGPPGHPATGPVLAALGAVVLVGAYVRGSLVLATLGALVLGVGAVLLALRATWRRGREEVDGPTSAEERLRSARQEERAARQAVEEHLADLRLREGILERPDPELAARLERLRETARESRDRRDALEERRARLRALADEVNELAEDLDLELPRETGGATHVLAHHLEEAERSRDAAASARRELDRLERERSRTREALNRATDEKDELLQRLRHLGDGDLERGVVEAVQRTEALNRARQLRAELERSHPDLEEIRTRIREAEEAGEAWVVDDQALARKRVREEELGTTIETLARTLEGLEKDMAYLGENESVDEIDGAIEALERELTHTVRRRDRLVVLAAVLREADRRFREEHQPDVLRRAGRHLATVTEGRYERILMDEDGTFLLRGPGYPRPMPVDEPLSTGIREQVYLALRLAMVDHLDQAGERLPLFLDEAFVNWDRKRRERAFRLLKDVAERRQVFVFTCHEPMAVDLVEKGGRLVSLEIGS